MNLQEIIHSLLEPALRKHHGTGDFAELEPLLLMQVIYELREIKDCLITLNDKVDNL